MRILHRSLIGIVVLTLSGSMAATAYGSNTTHPALASKTVKIIEVSGKYEFSPASITIHKGTRVIWTNATDAAHTITSTKSGLFNKNIAVGKKVSITFKNAGTFKYFCAIHPYMKAKVVVM